MASDSKFSSNETGFVALPPRTVIDVTGNDRATFLHNLCTADVQVLQPGQGTEAFFTDVKGRVLAHGFVLCGDDSLTIDTVGEQAAILMSHLDRYIIREDVKLHDRSREFAYLIVCGESCAACVDLTFGAAPKETLGHIGQSEAVIRSPMVNMTNFLVRLPATEIAKAQTHLEEAGAVKCGLQAFELLRIEACFPYYGLDITDRNLPQEVGRNKQAISFTKGCYLGQETVARLDALGHVNWELSVLRGDSAAGLASGSELEADGEVVARVGSSVNTPDGQLSLLAYVRAAVAKPGQVLETSMGTFQVLRVGAA